jgi:Xaa-Pro aminopeptidase
MATVLERSALAKEWPSRSASSFAPRRTSRPWGYDGFLTENMVISIEGHIEEAGGPHGVKLEEQVLITGRGAVPFSRSPLVDALQV